MPAKEVSEIFSLVTVASGARSLRSLDHGETFHPVVGPMAEARGLHVAQSRLVERARAWVKAASASADLDSAEPRPTVPRGFGIEDGARAKAGGAMLEPGSAFKQPSPGTASNPSQDPTRLATAAPFIIWDVGLGAAANAVAVLEAFQDQAAADIPVELHSFDCTLDPLAFARAHAAELGYLPPWLPAVDALLGRRSATVGSISWHLHLGDFRAIVAAPENLPAPAPHAILYDPYSPAANPGMWTLEHFTRLHAALRAGRPCTLTSYSRSTAVRVTLALAGFHLGRGTATGEKDETTIAATHRSLLAAPLGEEWLGRVQRSTKGAPLREHGSAGPISPEDLVKLSTTLNKSGV